MLFLSFRAAVGVALRKESVDRNNTMQIVVVIAYAVALRKESVDRNLWWGVRKAVGSLVALRKESVDRNFYYSDKAADWVRVALRKESVDRNREQFKYVVQCRKSLSARRAWIEIGWLLAP